MLDLGNESSWGRERQRIVILLYCFHPNVLHEHRSAADRIVNHKVCFAVPTLFVAAFSSKVAFPTLIVLGIPQVQYHMRGH